jgi:hypothetical protein
MSNYKYWDNINFTNNYVPRDKYILFDPYPAGFNNVRMSYEIAACMAYALNRILVISEHRRIAGLDEQIKFSEFYDLNNLGIQILEKSSLKESFNIKKITNRAHEVLYKLDVCKERESFQGNEILNLFDMDDDILYFPRNLFGNFYHAIASSRMQEIKTFIAKNFHYKENIFDLAQNAINEKLGDLDYYAIHIRRNDFNMGWHIGTIVLPAEEILQTIESFIPKKCKLYIATDEIDKSYFEPFFKDYDVSFYEDLNIDHSSKKYSIAIEQIICARAISFVGCYNSTFSTYINRLRGYMKDIEDKRCLHYCKKFFEQTNDENNFLGLFSREYSEAWNFNN